MSFWHDNLFDNVNGPDEEQERTTTSFQVEVAKEQVETWLERHSRICDGARRLLKEYVAYSKPPSGPWAPVGFLSWNWFPEGSVQVHADDPADTKIIHPVWNPDETDSIVRHRLYGRVSREVDMWWSRVHHHISFPGQSGNNQNDTKDRFETPSVELGKQTTKHLTDNHRLRWGYISQHEGASGARRSPDQSSKATVEDQDTENHPHDYVQELFDEDDPDDLDDTESYGEGPLTGLLTEIVHILDPKQIEPLHMVIKSCIVNSAGSGPTRSGENLQCTRCWILMALESGKSLLRELLAFTGLWELDEESVAYQLTGQIVEALHSSSLIPYAWNSLELSNDIMSPAQIALLQFVSRRLIYVKSPPDQPGEKSKDLKMVQFLFTNFRIRVVPACVALMNLQVDFRENRLDSSHFPIPSWDMERAKAGLSQYMEFFDHVCEDRDLRGRLIGWELVYDLLAILNGLEAAVPRKPLVELPKSSANNGKGQSPPTAEIPHSTAARDAEPPELAQAFPWSGIKGPIITIIGTLLEPPAGRTSPGNPDVQNQLVRHNGIATLLNCCAYDDHHPFARERVTVCLKWLTDGCLPAKTMLRDLINTPRGGSSAHTLRLEGPNGDMQVKIRLGQGQTGEGSRSGSIQEQSVAPPVLDDVARILNSAAARMNISGDDDEGYDEDDFM
jgi:palmitoyltransferase